MATLNASDRLETAGVSMREMAFPGLLKADIRAAINAIDQWVNDNAAAFNSAIPQPARGVLTSTQKAQLLMYVIQKRYQSGV